MYDDYACGTRAGGGAGGGDVRQCLRAMPYVDR